MGRPSWSQGQDTASGEASPSASARRGRGSACSTWTLETANETVRLIASAGGVAHAVRADVSKSDEVKKAVDEVVSKLGPIDVLVNNAGIRYVRKVLEMTDEEWNRTISINLTGMFYVTKAVAPQMLARGGGKVVNVGSMSGLIGQLGRAAYGASKGGVLQLTRSLAVELGPTINVNAVAPGLHSRDGHDEGGGQGHQGRRMDGREHPHAAGRARPRTSPGLRRSLPPRTRPSSQAPRSSSTADSAPQGSWSETGLASPGRLRT